MSSNVNIFAPDLIWCAPEVIKHNESASQKADIYSFGIILYELIGKHGPFGTGYQYSDKDLQGGPRQIRQCTP